MRFRAEAVAAATGGRLHGPDVAIDGVSFDSRSIQPGQLFVPMVAERDGHEFIAAALARGAAAYLTTRPPVGGTAIEVPDTLRGLMALAAVQRSSFAGPVIAITGSVGKTSTKDLAWAALAAGRPTWANERSFNNEQGLPTTLLNTPDLTEVLVLEMGMRGLGEIAELCSIARPTIGVITRVAEAHSDRVGGIEGVARAKAELIESVAADGLAILNADDPRVRAMAGASPQPTVLLYGDAPDGLRRARRPRSCSTTSPGPRSCRDHAVGRSAACTSRPAAGTWRTTRRPRSHAWGQSVAISHAAAAALAEVRPHRHAHGRCSATAAGAIVLDDSYNANPTSRCARRSTRWRRCPQPVGSRCSA
jgi:UDP-N-acetylmuramoyl-tripeptide--D-alanyl-D-alanine ligase